MLNSLRAWINLPFTIISIQGVDIYGDKIELERREALCYAEGKVHNITDLNGVDTVSNKILYVDGNTDIKELDRVLFEGRETDIKAITYYYRNGVVDIKLVHL